VIEDVIQLIRSENAGRGLIISVELEPDLPLVSADRIQIQQVLFNLARNGVDAMRSNGTEPMILAIKSRKTEQTVLAEVRDNGSGLAQLPKVFEPFFTTKKDGLGMGLSICRSMVVAHKGRLWGNSNPTRGATFAFELPLREGLVLEPAASE